LIHAKRHPIRLEYWAGCDADGHLTALRVRGIGDSGANASVGMKVWNVPPDTPAGRTGPGDRWRTVAVRTNNSDLCAFRASAPTRRSSR